MRKFAQFAQIRPIYKKSPNMRKFAQYAQIRPICANSPNLVTLLLGQSNSFSDQTFFPLFAFLSLELTSEM
jgi:hypothetical protein